MRVLTLAQLIEAKACPDQVKLFKKHFKKSIEVTEELAESLAGTFDFDWASQNLLTLNTYTTYDKLTEAARKKFSEDTAPTHRAREKVWTEAWAEYRLVGDPERKQAESARQAAWTEFIVNNTQAADAAWVDYDRACVAIGQKAMEASQGAYAKYRKACEPTELAHDEVAAPARAVLAKAKARAFARCYITDTDVAYS